jgi:hypothetical protein
MSFENLSDQDLADLIGQMNYKLKADEAELDRYKDEFKRRGVSIARGGKWIVSASTSDSKRLDTKKVKEMLGDALDDTFFITSTSTRISTKPVPIEFD